MKITKKLVEGGAYHIQASATAPEVDKALDASLFTFAQQMKLQPQQGKSVAQVVEEALGIKETDSVIITGAVNELAPYAVDKSGLLPAYPPTPQPRTRLARGATFDFEFTLNPKPEYELSSYDPVSITVPPFKVDEREVDRQLAQLSEQFAEYITDDPHPVGDGDHVLLALEVEENGEKVEGLSTEGRTYTVGIGLMPPSFDEHLIGMDVGETKTFTFGGPDLGDDGEQIIVEMEATATIKEIQKKHVAVVDDEWVAKRMPYHRDANQLREFIKHGIEQRYQQEYQDLKENLAAGELAKRFKGSIADEVYEATSRSLMQNLRQQLAQQGIQYEQFVQEQGGEQQFSMMMMMSTRESLVQGYALDALFRNKKLTVTDEDILAAAAAMNPQNPEQFRDYMMNNGRSFALRENAERLKASSWLVENAEITVAEE